MKLEVASIYQNKFDDVPMTYPHSRKNVEGSKQTFTFIIRSLYTVLVNHGGKEDSNFKLSGLAQGHGMERRQASSSSFSRAEARSYTHDPISS
jgi:hypothetical protein